MCVHGNSDRGDCSHIWTGLTWGVRPPTKVSSFPPVFLILFCFVFFLYIYIFVEFYFIFNFLFSFRHSGTAYLQNGVIVSSLSGGSHRAVGSV